MVNYLQVLIDEEMENSGFQFTRHFEKTSLIFALYVWMYVVTCPRFCNAHNKQHGTEVQSKESVSFLSFHSSLQALPSVCT